MDGAVACKTIVKFDSSRDGSRDMVRITRTLYQHLSALHTEGKLDEENGSVRINVRC